MIHPKKERYKVDKEFVVVFSDWTNEEREEVSTMQSKKVQSLPS